MRLAAGRLTEMAEGAGLRLSFSTERSVQDELARESTSGGACWLSAPGPSAQRTPPQACSMPD